MVKIADVARHAGVSPSTVSYVLSGKRSISAEVQERVRSSIEELGYRPHAGARALASSRSNVLALVLPLREGVFVPVLMPFAIAVVSAARWHDHDVLLLTQEEGEEGLRRVAASALVDGVVIMDVQVHDPRLPAIRALDRPVVLIGYPEDTAGLTCIDLDFTAAGALCVEHLASLGHRRIAVVGSVPDVYERETGFAQHVKHGVGTAAAAHDVQWSLHPCPATVEGAEDLVTRLLDEDPGITALVVHNEPVVEAVLATVARRGLRVPEDLSVLAICPDDVATRGAVPLTSVKVPAEELGSGAVDLLMTLLDGGAAPAMTLLDPVLTVRASTSSAPPAG